MFICRPPLAAVYLCLFFTDRLTTNCFMILFMNCLSIDDVLVIYNYRARVLSSFKHLHQVLLKGTHQNIELILVVKLYDEIIVFKDFFRLKMHSSLFMFL